MNPNHIFIDTNVLIGAYSNRQNDQKCLQYLFSSKGKRLFTSTLSIAQFVSVFQKKKTNTEIKMIIRYLLMKMTVIDFSGKDIEKSLEIVSTDMEDSIQYVISKKFHCLYFITNNKKDYSAFLNLLVFKPDQIKSFNSAIYGMK